MFSLGWWGFVGYCILLTHVPSCNSWRSHTNTGFQQWRAQSLPQSIFSTFYIVCVLVAFLREVRLGLVLARQTWKRILPTPLIWMHPGWFGADASVDHPGVTVVELLPSGDLKRLKGPDPTYLPPSRGQSTSQAGSVIGGVTDTPLPV